MSRVSVVLQSEVNECGLACLSMVLGYFADRRNTHGFDLASLRRHFPEAVRGLSAKQLLVFAGELGLASRGVRCEPQDLRDVKKPCVLHWKMDHFVVLVKTNRRGCVVHDPAQGRRLIRWPDVDRLFTGVALEFWRSAEPLITPHPAPRLRLSELLPLLQGMGPQLLGVALLSLVLQGIILIGPWQVQWTVDEALLVGDHQLLGVLAIGFAMLLVFRLCTQALRGVLVIHVSHALSFKLANGLLQHLLRLPLGWFERHHVGDVASRFASLSPVRDILTHGMATGLVDMTMVLLSLALMFVYSPALAMTVFLLHIVFLAGYVCLVPLLRRRMLGVVVAQAEEQSHLIGSIRSIRNIKVYAQERSRYQQWQSTHGKTLTEYVGLEKLQLGINVVAAAVSGGELILIIYLAAHQVLAGVFTVGMLFAFLSYRGHFAERMRGLIDLLISLRTLQTHLERLGEIWFESPDPVSHSAVEQDVPATGGDILLDQVGVRLAGNGPWIFRGVDLAISDGEYIAIVGPSGSGKTTLIKLLLGLIAPEEGVIRYAGLALQGQRLGMLRRRSASVMQGDEFLSGSILDNLCLFESPDLAWAQACLEQVDMLGVVQAMPMGLHTPLGDASSGFSSGQVQKLLLARALYQRAEILFLDEGTANLDLASAQHIQNVIRQLPCTRIIVTHDLSMAAQADRILLLERGELKQIELPVRSAAVQSAG